jgi:Gpi18-like mannosyltransferase
MHGYEYAADGRWHSIAFFPLYPIIVTLVMRLGIGFDLAGLLVNNLCFLAMLVVVFRWVERRKDVTTARWTVAFLALFPLSLFGSVTYSEGLFMLMTSLALRDFDRRHYGAATLWTALASLARPTGVLLFPAFVIAAFADRREGKALLPALLSLLGVTAVCTYSAIRFHDALAFVHAQEGWHRGFSYGVHQWSVLLASGSVSFNHWLFQLVAGALVIVLIFVRDRFSWVSLLLWCAIVAIEWLAWGDNFAFATIGLLGTAALLYFRRELGVAVTAYGAASILVFLLSGTTASVDRYFYGALPFSLAVGTLLARLPAFGIPLLLASALDLYMNAASFANGRWIA